MAQVIIDCIRANSGGLEFDGSTYTGGGSGPGQEYKEYDVLGILILEGQTLYQFDTSDAATGIPAANTITKVELYYNNLSGPTTTSPGPDQWEWWIYAGQFIGASLDANAGEWNGGSIVLFHTFDGDPPTTDSYLFDCGDLSGIIDRSGVTDFRIKDESTAAVTSLQSWSVGLDNGIISSKRGKLRITHEAPAGPGSTSVMMTPHAGI